MAFWGRVLEKQMRRFKLAIFLVFMLRGRVWRPHPGLCV